MGDQQHRVYKFAQHEPVVIDGRGASNAERVTASAAYSPPIREQLIGTPEGTQLKGARQSPPREQS